MLLEFTLVRSLSEKEQPARRLFLLMNQLVAVHEPPSFQTEDGKAVPRCMISTRGGEQFEVGESVADVLDAMKFATRHIGVSPGIADKVDGENEEVYPWRRGEKVAELARKWREHEKAKSNRGTWGTPPLPPKVMPPGLPPLTREGVSPPPSPPPSPAESSDEARSAGSATPGSTSESSPPESPPASP